MSWTFLVTSLVIVATPGTGALFTLATALASGARASILAAFACTLGTIPHLVAAISGLAALLQASGVAFNVVKYLGVAYLLFMAWATWRDTSMFSLADAPKVKSRRKVLTAGVTLNLLNPKLTIFFFAFLPQFVPVGTPHSILRMLALSAVFMAMTFLVFAAYGLCAAALRDNVLSRPRVAARIRRGFAASFVVMSSRLATETR